MLGKIKSKANKIKTGLCVRAMNVQANLAARKGEAYIDTIVKVLIAAVLGLLLLTTLYALFGDTVLPTLETKIKEMFNYSGK